MSGYYAIGVRAATAKVCLDQAQDYLRRGGLSSKRPFEQAMGKALRNMEHVRATAAYNVLARRYNELAKSSHNRPLLELREPTEDELKPPRQRSRRPSEAHTAPQRQAATTLPATAQAPALPPAPPAPVAASPVSG